MKLAERDDWMNSLIARVVSEFADDAFIDKLFILLKLQDHFKRYTCGAELAKKPDRFAGLLRRIDSEESRLSAARHGVRWLFAENRVEHLVPLIIALEAEAFFNPKLKDGILNKTFEMASSYVDDRNIWIKRLYCNPAIVPESYSSALWNSHAPIRYYKGNVSAFLLKHADQQDLEGIQRGGTFTYSQ